VTEQLDSMIDEFQNRPRDREQQDHDTSNSEDRRDDEPDPSDLDPESDDPHPSGNDDQWFETGDPYAVQSLQLQPPDRRARSSSGRRATTISDSSAGRYVGSRIPEGNVSDLALDATLRTAAPHQLSRRAAVDATPDAANAPAFLLEPWDIREKVRETKTGSLILFVVDASGSMGAQRRMVAVKGAVLSLLLDAYQRRDRVGLISFRGNRADLLLPPTNSVDLAQVYLQDMPTGGRTPLGRGLYLALEVLETERMKDRNVLPMLVVLSDGRANVTMSGGRIGDDGVKPMDEVKAMAALVREQRIPSVVIDTEMDFIKFEMARRIADDMGAKYTKLDELGGETLADAVRLQLPSTEQPRMTQEELDALTRRLDLT